jgi:hypothetical protein
MDLIRPRLERDTLVEMTCSGACASGTHMDEVLRAQR